MLEDAPTLIRNNSSASDEDVPAALTDIGCEREINEDRYAIIESPAGSAWVVCDGMGGEIGGELAAQLAIDAIRRGLESRDFSNLGEAVQCAVQEANRVIVLRRQNPAFGHMGTTVTVAMIRDEEIVIANVGDSRAYLIHDAGISQLTVDHTYVQELVAKGDITPEEALAHPQAHVLTKCLGAVPALVADLYRFWVWPGSRSDKLVLCSDGLYSLISDSEILEISSQNSPQEACVQLVELAKARGGYDNITVSILPLAGELRKDGPPPSAKNRAAKRPPEAFRQQIPVNYPWGKQLLKTLLVFLLGGLVGFVTFIFQVYSA